MPRVSQLMELKLKPEWPTSDCLCLLPLRRRLVNKLSLTDPVSVPRSLGWRQWGYSDDDPKGASWALGVIVVHPHFVDSGTGLFSPSISNFDTV